MQKTISTFTIIIFSSLLFNTLSVQSMEKRSLSGSGFFENHMVSPVIALSITLTHHTLDKHRKLINEGSNGDLLMHTKAYSPRHQNSSYSSAYMNVNAKTEAELLINTGYYETHNDALSEPAPINDENGLLY